MPAKTYSKQAGDLLDVGLDWADALADIGDGLTIVDSVWELLWGSIEINATGAPVGDLPAAALDDTQSVLWIKGGETGTLAKLKNTITTSSDQELVEHVEIRVLDISEHDPARTWIMRRHDGRVGSEKIIPKAVGEAPLFWANVSRLLARNEAIGLVGSIEVTADGIVASDIGKAGSLIVFSLSGGTVDSKGEPIDVVVKFQTDGGKPLESRGLLLITA